MRYDYKTVAAPRRSGKFKGIKGPDAFARTIEEAISAEAGAGWEYPVSYTHLTLPTIYSV